MDLRPSKRRCKQGYKLHPQVFPLHKLLGFYSEGRNGTFSMYHYCDTFSLINERDMTVLELHVCVRVCVHEGRRGIFQFQNISALLSLCECWPSLVALPPDGRRCLLLLQMSGGDQTRQRLRPIIKYLTCLEKNNGNTFLIKYGPTYTIGRKQSAYVPYIYFYECVNKV